MRAPMRSRGLATCLAVLVLLSETSQGARAIGGAGAAIETLELPVVFPEYEVTENDAYLCTSVPLPDRPLKLVGVESTSDQRIVHHMLLYGGCGGKQRAGGSRGLLGLLAQRWHRSRRTG